MIKDYKGIRYNTKTALTISEKENYRDGKLVSKDFVMARKDCKLFIYHCVVCPVEGDNRDYILPVCLNEVKLPMYPPSLSV